MSESDSDDGFLQVFGKKRNQRTSNYNKNVSISGEGSASSAPSETGVALRPPERKIAAAQRQHQRAVNTVLKQNNMQRNVALSGMAAHRQTLLNNPSTAEESSTSSSSATSNVAATSASTIPTKPSTTADITYTVAKEATLQDAINRATIIQDNKENKYTDKEIIIAWTTVRSIANTMLGNSALSLTEKDKAFRATLTALVREGDAHTRSEEYRAAIKAYELVYSLSKSVVDNDASKIKELKSGLIYVLKKLSELYTEIGSIDNVRGTFNRLAQMEAKPSATVTKDTPASPSPTKVSKTTKSREEKVAVVVTEEKKPVPVPVVPEEPKKVDITAESVPSTPPPSSLIPSPRPVIPSIPELDGTPQTLFTRAALLAMFEDNFEELNLLLNRALLSDQEALQAIKCVLPDTKINLVIICAATGRPDLLRRLLGYYTLNEQYSIICQYKDSNGNNSIAHASLLQRHEALHELLCSLHNTNPKYTPYTPSDSTTEDVASLPDLGLRLEQAQAFSRPIQDQLRSFLHNPSSYVKVATEAMNRTMSNGNQPPLPPPLPNGPPPPMNAWGMYNNRGPMTNMNAYRMRDQIAAAYVQFMQQFQQAQQMLIQNMNNMRIAPNTTGPVAPTMTVTTTTTPVSPSTSSATAKDNGEWEQAGGRSNNKNKNKNRKNNSNTNGPKESTLLDFLPSNVSKEAGEGKLVGRTLQAMELPPEESTNSSSSSSSTGKAKPNELLEDPKDKGKGKGKGKKWDQFAANETLFGINAQFDENAYTTVLDTKNFTKEQIANAEKLAAEILAAEDSLNPHIRAERGQTIEGEDELDEEALHSAVLGTKDGKNTTTGNSKDTFTDASIAKKSSKGKK